MDFVCKKNRGSHWFPWFLSLTPSLVLIIPKATVTIFSHTSMSLSPFDNQGRGGSHHIPAYSTPVHP